MSYGDAVELTQSEKRTHTFKVLCEWPSAREQLKLQNMYDPESGIHLGDKLWTNQQFNALKFIQKHWFQVWRHFRNVFGMGWNVGLIFIGNILPFPNILWQQSGYN